jgi:hypothetical protein
MRISSIGLESYMSQFRLFFSLTLSEGHHIKISGQLPQGQGGCKEIL